MHLDMFGGVVYLSLSWYSVMETPRVMSDKTRSSDEFSPAEARKRFEAALKGARIAGHKPKESLTRKKSKTPHKKA
jgi:hypothetical protein